VQEKSYQAPLRIWPQCDKLSRQDAATAIRHDVATRESVLQSIGLRRAAKPRCLARNLLSQARTVFQLDGSRSNTADAYHAAGNVVLNQSDLLTVVWDGERKNRRGGTEETFDEAIERGVLEQLEGDYGQIQFHETTASRCFRIEHRRHVMEVCLLGMTLASCGQHLAQSLGAHWFHVPSGLLTFFCAFFPAAGAALAGISNQ